MFFKDILKGLLLFTITLGLSIQITANEVVVYTSDNTVSTYLPIYPDSADPSWPSTICNVNSSLGLDAGWQSNGNAYEFGTNAHPWQPSVQLDAQWINAWSDLSSRGPGGHNWTRYTLEVSGAGEFDLTLLADNCSWIYLDGNLVGFQPASWNAPGVSLIYPVQLSSTHSLDFIIFDGGGLAGGMFRLETNTGRTFSDDDGDGLSNQEEIIIGTSPTNPDTDADGVSDGDEVAGGSDPLDDTSFPVVDNDQDGIEDANDYCADTEAGAVVNDQGCSGTQVIAQMCQCSGPSENKAWKSHGQYVSCVARARNAVLKQGLITDEEGELIVETAAESSCGKK